MLVVENESIYNGKVDIGRYATLYIELWYNVCIIQERDIQLWLIDSIVPLYHTYLIVDYMEGIFPTTYS